MSMCISIFERTWEKREGEKDSGGSCHACVSSRYFFPTAGKTNPPPYCGKQLGSCGGFSASWELGAGGGLKNTPQPHRLVPPQKPPPPSTAVPKTRPRELNTLTTSRENDE
ncbi:hypothetical protein KQX54_018695 [Cotesia glomerata]|uniref:Uncharacterized protein n=1 Tax=Cotesia glomerata TaxID=32391 RepID=A0AAV7I9D0_COTGL|nr:hypothetical protein KQX54_018695 [Cotesia glomerata]